MDYHLHTYFSDGSMSPSDIVKRANDLEYTEIAITDHDGINGVAEAQIAGKVLGLSVIAGIELSTEYMAEAFETPLSLHILGYHIDIKNRQLLDELEVLRENRRRRNEKLLKALKDMGFDLSLDDLTVHKDGDYIGKPVIARAMKRKGYINTVKAAFEPGMFLESKEIKEIKKDKISAQRAIELIKDAGGISVLAHPMKIKKMSQRGSDAFYSELDGIIRDLKKAGLKGIECYHTDHGEEESLKLVELAEKYHMHITRGSDYHGPEMEE